MLYRGRIILNLYIWRFFPDLCVLPHTASKCYLRDLGPLKSPIQHETGCLGHLMNSYLLPDTKVMFMIITITIIIIVELCVQYLNIKL